MSSIAKCDLCDSLGNKGGYISIWEAIDKDGNTKILCTECANKLRFNSNWIVDSNKMIIREPA